MSIQNNQQDTTNNQQQVQGIKVEPTKAASSSPQITQPASVSSASANASSEKTESMVTIKTKDGNIVIKLYDKVTPKTVENFLSKIKNKFYDGLTFHRVIPGFMAQGGDPTATGMGGGQIASELNNLPFKKGSLGLARTPASKEISNDSQFFICYDDFGCQHLTGDYVNFGEVTSGFEALNKIENGDKMITVSINK